MTRIFQIMAAATAIAAAPAGSARHAAAADPRAQGVVAHEAQVPGIVLIGMAVAGFAIVGVASRRRQPGRSVTKLTPPPPSRCWTRGDMTMEQARSPLTGAIAAERVGGPLGHPNLLLFDRVRALLVSSGLPPETPVFDLLMRHVAGDDPVLSAAVEAALAAGLDLAGVAALRRAHCGDVTPGEVGALVEAAHGQAAALTARLTLGASEAARYGEAIAAGDAELRGPAPDTAALARLIARLGDATAAMVEANARLQAELAAAASETGALQARLKTAEMAAVTDPLTGVLNRRGALKRLEVAQTAAREAAAALSIAMVDIDHFKHVNDRFGHAMGDEVLRYVADHLSHAVGDTGAVGRLGGEEFVVLLPGAPLGAATAAIDKARGALAARIIRRSDDGTSMGRVSFSAGTAQDRAGDTPGTLLARADGAMYDAKRMGRDRVVPAS